MQNAKETDKAYAAGLFDGEGSVGVGFRLQSKNSTEKTFSVKVSISMIDADSIIWMRAIFGGHVDTTNKTKSGTTVYRWTLHCRKAADFLELVLPYLKLKKARAEAAIKLARLARKKGAPKGRYQMPPMTRQEVALQEPLALFIRSENQRSNPRIVKYSKWGIQQSIPPHGRLQV